MVKYEYDAWGDHNIILSEPTYENLAKANPFRYRGYYYDEGIGLYYLKSRYYDPETGRFITIDDISYLDPETINGLNLYAYCGNNPVMRVDENGDSWDSVCKGVKNFFTRDIPNFFTKTIPNWWNNDVVPFFTQDVPNFFTKTIPNWWNGTVVPWWNNDIAPFFTQDIPNFFTKTIPDFFVNTFWNNLIVDKVWNQFIVGTIWNKGLLPAWNWVKGNWKTVVDWITAIVGLAALVIGGLAYVVTLPMSLTITAFIAGGIATIWGAGRVFRWW